MTQDDFAEKEYNQGYEDWLAEVGRIVAQITEGLGVDDFPPFDSWNLYCTGATAQQGAEACLAGNDTGQMFLEGF